MCFALVASVFADDMEAEPAKAVVPAALPYYGLPWGYGLGAYHHVAPVTYTVVRLCKS